MTILLDIRAQHAEVAGLIDVALAGVAERIDQQLRSGIEPVNELCRGIERYRGKMLRPSMVVACGLATGLPQDAARPVTADMITIGAVIELVHLATLVHDDVLDGADVRRGGESINHERGNETAVILGDFLISKAYHLCSQLDTAATALRIAHITNTVCEGEILQIHHRGDFNLSEEVYFKIIERKTAALIGVACELGAQCVGASRAVCQAMWSFGIKLGVAFQIQDDLLDLIGDEAVVGKSLGKDLEKGKLTLPLIHHLARLTPDQRKAALATFAGEAGGIPDRRLMVETLNATGSIQSARAEALTLIDDAKALLHELPETPARHYLDALADAVVSREF